MEEKKEIKENETVNKESSEENRVTYKDISERYKMLKWLAFILLGAFVLFSFVFNSEELTIDNAKYLIKHFDINTANDASSFNVLRYDYSTNYSFDYFKDDIAIASSTELSLYDVRGNLIFSNNHSMSNPVLKSSESYLYAYDIGNYSLSVYNSYTRIYDVNLKYPVYLIAPSNSGNFAMLTRSMKYTSDIMIYDRDYNLQTEILKDELVMDMDLSDNGKDILICSCDTSEDGKYYTTISLCTVGKEESVYEVDIEWCDPVSCHLINGNKAIVLCSDRLVFLDRTGEILGQYYFDGAVPTAFDAGEDYCIISFDKYVIGYQSLVHVFDQNGNETAVMTIDGSMEKLKSEKNYSYGLLSDSIVKIGVKDGSVTYESTTLNPLDFFVRGDSSLLVCYSDKTEAIPYSFGKTEKED